MKKILYVLIMVATITVVQGVDFTRNINKSLQPYSENFSIDLTSPENSTISITYGNLTSGITTHTLVNSTSWQLNFSMFFSNLQIGNYQEVIDLLNLYQENDTNLTSTNNITIFIDESGKPEVYSSKGVNLVEFGSASKFLILASVRTEDQLDLSKKVSEFKLSLLRDDALTSLFSSSYTLDAFHAQTDYPEVKKKFYEFINTLDIKIDVIVVEKLKCHPALKDKPGRMYGVMAGQLIKNLAHQAPNVEVIFSLYQHNG